MNVSVVGAGVMGLAAARALAQRGHDVTVYEQFELEHTRGSSHGGSRIFRLSYPDEYWVALAQRAYELWRELEHESGRQLLVPYGLLDVEQEPAERLAVFDSTGVPYEELTPGEARERFGVAYDDVPRLVFTSDAGISLADRPAARLRRKAKRYGAEIREHARIESLDDVPGDRVVVTAGGWAPKLLAGCRSRARRAADARDRRVLLRRADPVRDRHTRRSRALRADRAWRRCEGGRASRGQADRSGRRPRAGRGRRRTRERLDPPPPAAHRPDAASCRDVHLHERRGRPLRLRAPRPLRRRLRLQRPRLQVRARRRRDPCRPRSSRHPRTADGGTRRRSACRSSRRWRS